MSEDSDDDGTRTVYITKYALTKGVYLVKSKIVQSFGRDCVEVNGTYYELGKEAHIEMDGAIARVEVMRQAKIKSLRKALDQYSKPITIPFKGWPSKG